MLPQGADGRLGGHYDGRMPRLPPLLAAAALALPLAAPGAQEGTGLPPTAPRPGELGGASGDGPRDRPAARGGTAPRKLPPAAVLEEVTGTVSGVDRKAHRIQVASAGGPVELAVDRNTLVYTSRGLGTVADVVPGSELRAGRNASFVAYWIQVRAPQAAPPATAPGTGPGGGSGAPPSEGGPAPGTAPGGTAPGGTAGPGTSAAPPTGGTPPGGTPAPGGS
jgi:hypothetical protein